MGRKSKAGFYKLTADELKIDFNLGRGDMAFCMDCQEEIDVSAVIDNPEGDWCTTSDCVGEGWGKDLFAVRWWDRG